MLQHTDFHKSSPAVAPALLCMLCLLIFVTSVQADERASHWLQRMNKAVSELNYDGHFVYLRNELLDAMQIRHRVEEGNIHEYIISLTGTAREVIRNNDSITILQSRNGKTHISQRRTASKLSPLPSLAPRQLDANYRLLMGEDVRMAGRAAKVVLLQPKDNLRYGCRLVLDQANALPLGVTLFDEDGKQISRIMFTDLKIRYPVEEMAAADDQVSIQRQATVPAATSIESNETISPLPVTDWRFNRLPSGYQLKNYHLRNRAEAMGQMEHFVFTDGLATVSVYVEPLADAGLQGEAKLGAVNALGAKVHDHQLTIVGEVPVATLKMLLSGAHLNAG